jgi:hypothetical protein
VRYYLFYNRDGGGVPYGLVIRGRQKQSLSPHPGNPDGEGVFKVCSTNQEFKPRRAPVDRFNDTNAWCPFTDSRITPPLQWVLFPQFGWGQGGSGPALLQHLRQEMEEKHLNWWAGATRQPSAEIFLRTWPMRQPPSTLWRRIDEGRRLQFPSYCFSHLGTASLLIRSLSAFRSKLSLFVFGSIQSTAVAIASLGG